MKRPAKLFSLVVAMGILVGALAIPAGAAGLPGMADIMDETEYENRSYIAMEVGERLDLNGWIRWREYDDLVARDRELLWELRSVTWQSSYETVLGVDRNGMATAHQTGYAKVTATGYDHLGQRRVQTISVGVVSSATATAAVNALEVQEGKRIGLAALIDPDGAKSPAWSSSNTGIAQVDADGLLNPLSIGRCTITATWTDLAGREQQETVSVRVISGLLDKTGSISLVLSPGSQLDMAAFYYPLYNSAGSLRDLSLRASQSAVATTEGMTLTAQAAGSCVVSINEKSDGWDQETVQRFSLTVKG